MSVSAAPDRTLYTGEDVTLTCDITLDPAVDINLPVTASWTGPDGTLRAGRDMTDAVPYHSTLTLSSLTTSDAGDYTCSARIIGSVDAIAAFTITVGKGPVMMHN